MIGANAQTQYFASPEGHGDLPAAIGIPKCVPSGHPWLSLSNCCQEERNGFAIGRELSRPIC